MNTFSFDKTQPDRLVELKRAYLGRLSHPLDGMWESFGDMADHYNVLADDVVCGYCAINSERKILKFSIDETQPARTVFRQAVSQLEISGAVAATCEPEYLSLCLDLQKSVNVNALMYHIAEGFTLPKFSFPAEVEFKIATSSDLDVAVQFGTITLGADPNWLKGYFEDRIDRGELFGLWKDGRLIATGECRPSDTQQPYADLGMIVAKEHRGKGLATDILRELIRLCEDRRLKPICSTERDNIGAQKAIEKSGFISHHRILDVTF